MLLNIRYKVTNKNVQYFNFYESPIQSSKFSWQIFPGKKKCLVCKHSFVMYDYFYGVVEEEGWWDLKGIPVI